MIGRLETVILYGNATYGRDVYEPLVHATVGSPGTELEFAL